MTWAVGALDRRLFRRNLNAWLPIHFVAVLAILRFNHPRIRVVYHADECCQNLFVCSKEQVAVIAGHVSAANGKLDSHLSLSGFAF
jgi:hypothetical protein